MNPKRSHRDEARARRATLARAIPDHAALLGEYADALEVAAGAMVAGYVSLPDEADPHILLKKLVDKGCELCFPRVAERDKALIFHRWQPGGVFEPGAFGVPEPSAHWPETTPSVLLVPMLAFDAEGHRLGYGGGYYDRTLEALRKTGSIRAIGVAFSGQEVASLPRQAHDQQLDMIVTELGVRRFKAI